MRLVLVLAVIVLVAAVGGALWVALAGDSALPTSEPSSIEPATPVERAAEPPIELAPSERSSSVGEREIATPISARAASGSLASIAIVALDDAGPVRASDLAVECRDGLGRSVELSKDPDRTRRATALAPGEYTVSVASPSHVTAVERITVRPITEEQRFEIRAQNAAVVRVLWQAEDGTPILDALAAPGILSDPVLARIALHSSPPRIGAPAPASRHSAIFAVPPVGQPSGRREPPWAGAPADAMCELRVTRSPPVTVVASIDGTVVGTAPVEEGMSEVIVRTPLALVRQLRTTVRFCLVDAQTGAPIRHASVSGQTLAGVGRSELEVGPDGCGVDTRFTAGRWLLSFSSDGRAPLRHEVELAPGTDLDLGVLRLDVPLHIAVRAAHADGRRAAGVQLSMQPAGRTEWGARSIHTTNADGEAIFTDLSREPQVLYVCDPRFTSRAVVVEPRSGRGAAEFLEVRVESGVEIALDFGPLSSADPRVFLYESGGLARAPQAVPDSGLLPLRLLPGDYVVELEGASSARAITVTDESVVFEMR